MEHSDVNDDLEEDDAKGTSSSQGRQIIVILDLASLETVKTKKGDFQLLNCDDHVGLMKKYNKDPAEYRPDIAHQEMMAILDSPLNKAGKIKLLRVVKNPISRHIPAGAICYGLSHTGVLHNAAHWATSLPSDRPIVLVFGAMASGSISLADHPYMQKEMISISEYPLSGVVAINRVLGAVENHWGIV